MSHTPKLEVLGQISERAREIDSQVGASARFRAAEENSAGWFALRDADWAQRREALLLVGAVTVNWLLAGDAPR